MVRREPPEAVSQDIYVEVDEQPDGQPRKSQIRDDLGFVNREQTFDCLELFQDTAADDQVEAISAVNMQPLVAEW